MKIETKNIELFIFDFGGVLYEINQLRTLKLIKEYSEDRTFISENINLEAMLSFPEFHKFEKGEIDVNEFRNFIRSKFSINSNDTIINNIWNSTLTGLYADSFDRICKFNRIGKTALLSNTNILHYNKFEPECRDIFSLFNYLFFSFKVGKRKPDKDIYEYVLHATGIQPVNSILFDDSEINIISAANTGMKTFHITDCNQLDNLFKIADY